MSPPDRSRRGFTLVEVAISIGVLGLVFSTLSMFLGTAQDSYRAGSTAMNLETQGSRVIRRIVDALRPADDGSITAVPSAPFSASEIDFQTVTPYDGQQSTYSAPLRIGLDVAQGTVRWEENPGAASERRSTWSGGVTDYLEGEVFNGLDDNGNGLIDERGLCFSREGDLLTIRLTLATTDRHGKEVSRTWTAEILCRN